MGTKIEVSVASGRYKASVQDGRVVIIENGVSLDLPPDSPALGALVQELASARLQLAATVLDRNTVWRIINLCPTERATPDRMSWITEALNTHLSSARAAVDHCSPATPAIDEVPRHHATAVHQHTRPDLPSA